MTTYAPFKDDILRLLREGKGVREISRLLGCSPQTVMLWKRKPELWSSPVVVGEEDRREEEPGPPTTPPAHERGRGLLWSIALDPSAPPAARVNAIDKLREIESWDFLVGKQDRTLPPPLSRESLVQRLSILLGSVEEEVLVEALGRLHLEVREKEIPSLLPPARELFPQPPLEDQEPPPTKPA